MPTFLENYTSKIPAEKRKSAIIAYLAALDHLKETNPTIAKHILDELAAQRSCLKLIASENYCSLTVQLAMGNLLTDKYCEGYPFHRFYAGCENVDAIESECCEAAKALFKAESAYVQPHSGADANLVAFWSILTTRVQNKEVERLQKKNIDAFTAEEFETLRQQLCNQKVMGLALSSGGHLTHGYRHNVSGKMMRAVPYDVDPQTHLLDYDAIATIAKKERPLILLAGYSAYSRLIDFAKMRSIAESVGAVLMCDMAHFAGLVAGGVFTGNFDPVKHSHIVTSTTHKTLRGPRGGLVLATEEFAESVNKGCPLILGGPLPHVIAAKAIAFKEANTKEFSKYAHKIVENAKSLAEFLMKEGINVVTGGTDNHLLIIDLTPLKLSGRQGETALRSCGITVNRNMIPFDPNGPWYTSGVRVGTPALTTLGMGREEMKEVASLIAKTLKSSHAVTSEKTKNTLSLVKTDEKVLHEVKERIKTLLGRFPLYPELIV